MVKKILFGLALFFTAALLYLLMKNNPITPVSWQAPANRGLTGVFAVNQRLENLQLLHLGEEKGPEDLVIDNDGWIYASVHDGKIIRMRENGTDFSVYANNLGRPLGLAIGMQGSLYVADAYLGLLSIDANGVETILVDEVEVNGKKRKLAYANNLVVASNGWVYFSEASYKFGAKQYSGSYPASLLDLMEHGAYGSVFVYKPESKTTEQVYSGFHFANGVALSHDEKTLYLAETGSYRILKLALTGEKQVTELVKDLPAFPDNITQGLDGKYWVGLVSPRNKLLDSISDKPFLRHMVQNLPAFLRPKATYYGHVFAFDESGRVVENFQDATGSYPTNTSVLETPDYLYIGSLLATKLGRLKK